MGTPSIPLDGYDGTFRAETNGSYDVRQYMAVKKGSDELHVTPLGSGDTGASDHAPIIVGIAQADADDGEAVRVRIAGISMVRAEGAIAQGDLCEAIYDASDEDKNGNMKKLTACADGYMIACEALEDAADGEYFKALIIRRIQHPAWS